MVTDFNADVRNDRNSTSEQPRLRQPASVYRNRRIVAVLAVAAASIFGVDHAAAHDQTICTTTEGADTVWNNGSAAVRILRENGANISDLRDVTDELSSLPNYEGARSGIGICAVQTTGIVGSIEGATISIEA